MKENRTIMIVDDEEEVRETLEALLAGKDYSFVMAGSGPEALSLSTKVVPDLILLDVMLPGMDGFETCRKLLENVSFKDVPIIMITALDDSDSRMQALDAGAVEFISKPFDSLELELRVATMLELSQLRKSVKSLEEFGRSIDAAPCGIIACDPSGIIRYLNGAAVTFLAASENKPLGKKIGAIIDLQGGVIADLCKEIAKLTKGTRHAVLLSKNVEGFAKGIDARFAPAVFENQKVALITFLSE